MRRPSPSPRICTDEGRSYGDVITEFSGLHGLPIFLTVLRWCASRAEAIILIIIIIIIMIIIVTTTTTIIIMIRIIYDFYIEIPGNKCLNTWQ